MATVQLTIIKVPPFTTPPPFWAAFPCTVQFVSVSAVLLTRPLPAGLFWRIRSLAKEGAVSGSKTRMAWSLLIETALPSRTTPAVGPWMVTPA